MEINSPVMRLLQKPANFIVPMVLFILFTPGVLLRTPRFPSPIGIPMLNVTNQVIVHSLVFGAAYFTLQAVFPQFYY